MSPFNRVLRVALPYLALLYLFGLTDTGVLSTDEPRYAAVGRQMAISGDWVTPRLWGKPWFEKPPLLYWMIATATRLGFDPDLAPRAPVALTAIVFLIYFMKSVRRLFDDYTAYYATLCLATTAGWLAYGFVGVTDLPMAATLTAAVLLCLKESPSFVLAGFWLGVSALAKGAVPLVLFLPVVWWLRGQWRGLLKLAAAFLVTALPWYVLCTARNGNAVLAELIWKHQIERAYSPSLGHVQHAWYYVPVLLAGLFPWTPLAGVAFLREIRGALWNDKRLRFLLIFSAFGFLFFSAASNKLPGYLLPLLPPLAILMGAALSRIKNARWWLLACTLLLALIPAIAAVLPLALIEGLTHVKLSGVPWIAGIPFAIAAGCVWYLESQGSRMATLALLAVALGGGVLWIKRATLPMLDRSVSARRIWRQLEPQAGQVCLDNLRRDWVYGLDYYAGRALPLCGEHPMPIRFHARSMAGK